jgi:hypothetical protein
MVSAMRLDILSAILTVFSMTEVGQKRWQGWALAFANSIVVCILALHVAPKQWALIPPNVFCLFIYARNLRKWKHAEDPQYKNAGRVVMAGSVRGSSGRIDVLVTKLHRRSVPSIVGIIGTARKSFGDGSCAISASQELSMKRR